MANTTVSAQAGVGRVMRIVLWAMLPLLLAEVAARALEPRFPPAPEDWGTPELPYKLSILPPQGADILVVGTSGADAGVNSAALQEVVGGTHKVFNGSLGAGTLPMVAWATETFWLPELDPGVVIIGVTSRDLNANDPRQAARSSAFFGSTEVRAMLDEVSAAEQLDRWLTDVSSLWAHRTHLRSWEAVSGQALGPWGPAQTGPDGQYLVFSDTEYEPSDRQFDFIRTGALNDWQVSHERVEAIRQIVNAARLHGAHVLLVDLPTTGDWAMLHPNGMQDVRAYQSVLSQLADDLDLPVVQPDPFGVEFFADVIHLNRRGSDRLSVVLGRCIVDIANCPVA